MCDKRGSLKMVGYAVIELGSKQHRVSVGEKLMVDLHANKMVGDTIEVDRVMMLGGETYQIGRPFIGGAKVVCTVSDMGKEGEGVKGEKLRVYKKKRRKGFDKTIGHRQRHTEVIISDIIG
jgi:large subunit ribosomal protein L21